jgi:Zn-finger nucleic acid-binding protein
MQLIACPTCHAQYDVSLVIVDRFDCRCGASLENEPPKPADAEIHRCGSCGAQVGGEAASCEYCGSEIVRDPGALSLICPECYSRNADTTRFCAGCGVAFQPEPLPVEGRECPCPDCGALMPPTQVAGVALNECRGCRGLWVPGDHFDLLVTRAADQRAKSEGAAPDPRVRGANPIRQSVRYRKCPECDAFMHRRNYRKSSGVIVDECREHGTWLDPDELEQIAGFILSGGETSKTFADEDRKCTEAAAAAARARTRLSQHMGPGIGSTHRSEIDLVDGLVGVLSKIFS